MPSPWASDSDSDSPAVHLELPRRKSAMSTPPDRMVAEKPRERKRVLIQAADQLTSTVDGHISRDSVTPNESRSPSRPSSPGPSRPGTGVSPAAANDDRHDEIKNALREAFGGRNSLTPPTPAIARPRPILRRGHSDPDADLHSESIQDLSRKELSARVAHERARSVATSVASAPGSRSASPHRLDHYQSGSTTAASSFYDLSDLYVPEDQLASGQTTPGIVEEDYVPRPTRYRAAGLGSLLKLTHARERDRARKLKGRNFEHSRSSNSLAELVHASTLGFSVGASSSAEHAFGETRPRRRPPPSTASSFQNFKWPTHKGSKHRADDEVKVQWHIQETIIRQKYLIKLCRALMQYGAPPHRLEEYMRMSARSLDIDAQFLFVPGCMIISFDDAQTHTTEVKLVKLKGQALGVDLGKLRDTHSVYKEVVHDLIGTDEATKRLDEIMARKDRFGKWTVIFFYGLASLSVGPWAYEARFIDLGLIFMLGCLVGTLKRFSLRSELYSNVFTVFATIVISFLARALGSISHNGARLFCFSGMTQSALTLILPGYQVLCAALELQSGSIVAGSVRMVHAIIYSLFLGYGITIGTAIYGAMDSSATSAVNCVNPPSGPWQFAFVALFCISIIVINQGKIKQMPVMVLISLAGWAVSHYSGLTAFKRSAQVSSSLAAAAVGVLANLYSRTGWIWDVLLRKIARFVHPGTLPASHPTSGAASPEKSGRSTPSTLEDQVPLPPTRLEKLRLQLYEGLIGASRNVRTKKMRDLHKRGATWHEHQEHADSRSPSGASSPDNDSIHSEKKSKKRSRKETSRSANEGPVHISHSLAATAMTPAVWVLVPSGLAIHGSLLQGIVTADQLTHAKYAADAMDLTGSTSLGVGFAVLQVGIGITVGLFLGSLLVYPFGKGPQVEGKSGGKAWKMRSGLFSL